ncbi:MAG: THUMP domain-containing protein [Candidatus Thorarchaeota archaeon]
MFTYFLVSSKPYKERNALSEVFWLFTQLFNFTKPKIHAQPLEVRGLGLLEFIDSPITFTNGINKKINFYLSDMHFCDKITPLEGIIKESNPVEKLFFELKYLKDYFKENEKWKIQINKRHSSLKKELIISKVASIVKNGIVDLKNPEKIIQIEIIKNWIGYGIIKHTDIISLTKKRNKQINE